jgi:predicted ATP-dependent endonuclease of OLD family
VYITKVAVKNFRNYKDFNIELKPFTILIGENNIGKSNLLEAMFLVLSHDISVYRKRKLDIEDINTDAIREFKKSILSGNEKVEFPEVRVDLYFTDPDSEQESIINDCWFDFSKKIARLSYVYRIKQHNTKKLIESYKGIVNQKREEGKADEEILQILDFPINEYDYSIVGGVDDKQIDTYWLKFMKMEYLDALRDAKTELNSSSGNKLLYRILADRNESDYGDIKDEMLKLDQLIKSDKSFLKNLRDTISEYLNRLSLETETSSNRVDFEFGSVEVSEILKKIGIKYGDNAVSIDRNGLGRNNLLYIAVVMAHLYGKQENYYRLIAIEEPEAHLCPILQKHLADNLYEGDTDNKKQIIITTHSTHIASYLDLEKTVILYKNEGEVRKHYILEGFSKKKEDKNTINYLKKWLNATNSTMFYSRKLIFVEGIAEQILIPIFYEWKYGKKINKANCQVINVNGVAFEHFLKIVKNGYFLKTAVLTDSDNDTKTEHRASDLKTKYDSDNMHVFITSNTTFEKDIFDANSSKAPNRELIVEVLCAIRPIKCDAEWCTDQKKKLDTQEAFTCMEEYKSDFAFELADRLTEKMNNKTKTMFSIPAYIEEAFKFIEGA